MNARDELGEMEDEYIVNDAVPTLFTYAILPAVVSVGFGSVKTTHPLDSLILNVVLMSTVPVAAHIEPLTVKLARLIAVITVAPLWNTVPLNVLPQTNVCVPVLTSPLENAHASGRLKV